MLYPLGLVPFRVEGKFHAENFHDQSEVLSSHLICVWLSN